MANRISARFRYISKYYFKHYGIKKTLMGLLFYVYLKLSSIVVDLDRPHVVSTNGYKLLTIPRDQGISLELLIFGTHEPLTTSVLTSELKKGMYCLDVGSNIGYYALLERTLVGNEGTVLAIEPSPVSFKNLTNNFRLNGFTDVKVFNIALTDSDNMVSFYLDPKSNRSRVMSDNPRLPTNLLPGRSLDSFVRQNQLKKLDLLRMDVEGHEVEIFKGAWSTLSKFKPAILIEIHLPGIEAPIVDLFTRLMEIGYSVKYFMPRELDNSIIGGKGDIRKFNIKELIGKIVDKSVPAYFNVYLVNKHWDKTILG